MSGTRVIATTSRKRAVIKLFYLQDKAPKEINAILTKKNGLFRSWSDEGLTSTHVCQQVLLYVLLPFDGFYVSTLLSARPYMSQQEDTAFFFADWLQDASFRQVSTHILCNSKKHIL